jgi:hypothetical protein
MFYFCFKMWYNGIDLFTNTMPMLTSSFDIVKMIRYDITLGETGWWMGGISLYYLCCESTIILVHLF